MSFGSPATSEPLAKPWLRFEALCRTMQLEALTHEPYAEPLKVHQVADRSCFELLGQMVRQRGPTKAAVALQGHKPEKPSCRFPQTSSCEDLYDVQGTL